MGVAETLNPPIRAERRSPDSVQWRMLLIAAADMNI